VEQERVRYEVGAVSRVAVTQAVSGAADREATAIRQRARVRTVQDQLLNLILAPDTSRYNDTKLIPESPALVEYQVDDDVAVQRALETRTEIALARTRLEDAQVQLDFSENQVLPELNLVGSYTLSGLSGSAKEGFTVDGIPPPPAVPVIPPGTFFPRTYAGNSGASGATNDYFGKSAQRSWGITAELSIPIPNTTARAEQTQRRIEYRRARTDLRRTEQGIILGTRFAARALRAALATIVARQRGEEAAAEALRAEQEKLRLGDSTPFDVLQFEEDLASAENGLIVALQIYRDAITALEKAQGVLLERRGIRIATELARF
jgi:outer membrane protein TolC